MRASADYPSLPAHLERHRIERIAPGPGDLHREGDRLLERQLLEQGSKYRSRIERIGARRVAALDQQDEFAPAAIGIGLHPRGGLGKRHRRDALETLGEL